MPTLKLPSGGDLSWTENGTGPTAVLVHGSPADRRAWGRVLEHLPGLRLVTPDLPGYGMSDPLPSAITDRSAAMGNAIALLIEHQDDPVLLAGHSYGGNVALHAAAQTAHNVRGLLLLEPVFFRALTLTDNNQAVDNAGRFFESYITRVEAGDPSAVSLMIDYWFGPGAFSKLPDPVRAYLQHGAPANAVDVRAAFSEVIERSALDAIRAPTTIVHGGASPDITMSIANALAALLPDAAAEELAEGTHAMLDADPAGVAAFVADLHQRTT